jgi:hypothetical protein
VSDAEGAGSSEGVGPAELERRTLREMVIAWHRDPVDRFGVVLFFVVGTIVVSSLVEIGASWRSSLLVTVISGAALIATGRAVGMRHGHRRVLVVGVVVVLAANVLFASLEALDLVTQGQQDSGGLVWLLLVLVAPVLVIQRIFAHRVVAMRTVLGAVTAYLQIAIAYAVAFQAVDAWSAQPFFGSEEPSTTYMYASLTTIATLGLGDVAPVGNLPRLVLASESVLGQVFLVTVVAVVVSRFAESHHSHRADRAEE